MSEMVERVAKAIAAQWPNAHLTKWEDCDEDFKWARRREAKAAIEAMREPTGNMTHIARHHGDITSDRAAKAWRDMIDEALK